MESCIQHERVGEIRSILDRQGRAILPCQVLDVSERGMILVDGRGRICLRDSSDSTVDTDSAIGNSLEGNTGGVGLLIPNPIGHSIVYAGAKFEELNIASFLPRKALSAKFNWDTKGDPVKNFISSIDYHEGSVVLGLRRSVIVFKLDSETSAPTEPDKLRKALQEYQKNRSAIEKECTLDHDTSDTQMKSASKFRNESEDTSNIQTESESELESTESQDNQASDSEMDDTLNDTRDPQRETPK